MAEKYPNLEGEYKDPKEERKKAADLTPEQKALEDLLRRSDGDAKKAIEYLELEERASDVYSKRKKQEQDIKDREYARRERSKWFTVRMIAGVSLIVVGTTLVISVVFGAAGVGYLGLGLVSLGATILGFNKGDKPLKDAEKWADK